MGFFKKQYVFFCTNMFISQYVFFFLKKIVIYLFIFIRNVALKFKINFPNIQEYHSWISLFLFIFSLFKYMVWHSDPVRSWYPSSSGLYFLNIAPFQTVMSFIRGTGHNILICMLVHLSLHYWQLSVLRVDILWLFSLKSVNIFFSVRDKYNKLN